MTQKEIDLCRIFGARWVTRDRGGISVSLWGNGHEPEHLSFYGIYLPRNGYNVASIAAQYFPSIAEDSCVEVPEEG